MLSPLLDQYNQDGQVTPALQRALDVTRQNLGAAALTGPPPPNARAPLAEAPAPAPQPAGPTPVLAPPPASTPALLSRPAATPAQPASLQPTPHEQELARLTTGDTGKSGISQIHHAAARVPLQILDALGSAFVPSLTSMLPGTQLHHQMLVSSAKGNVAEDEGLANNASKRNLEAAQTAETAARAPLEEAQTDEAKARAESLLHPEPKEEMEGKTLETDQGIFQWDPATKRYDIKAGNAKGAKETGTVHQLEDGTLVVAHPDGSATAVTLNGNPVKGKVTEKEPNQYADFKADYLTRHPNAGADEIQKAFKLNGEKPEDHGITGFAGGKVVRLEPGQAAPSDFQTSQQAGTANTPTMQMRTAGARAQLAAQEVPGVIQEITALKDQLGPIAGRWSEFMQGKVGAPNPEIAGLRSDLIFLSSAVALAHAVGRLPENLREEFDQMINAPKQSPENLITTLNHVQKWMQDNAQYMTGRPGGAQRGGGGIPTVSTKAEYDKLPSGAVYMEDGRKFKKP
jgi:hypothetical protein